MPTILETFQDYETDLLEMIIEQWGIQDEIKPNKNIKKQLANLLINQTLLKEIFLSLPIKAKSALKQIQSTDGTIPAAQFMRLYGEIREMGAGARGKKRPDRNPANISEVLFYKGLIALSFFNQKNEAAEYIFIPQEILAYLESFQGNKVETQILPITSANSIKETIPSSDKILDNMCSMLAALRGAIPAEEISQIIPSQIQRFLHLFFLSQGIINNAGFIVDMDKLKQLLVEERCKSFSKVCISWMEDPMIDELRLLPHLSFEGKWKNNPIKTRSNLLEILSSLRPDIWYAIPDFIEWMHHAHSDFQRSRGEYDLWFIKDTGTDRFVNGFENWHEVEGKLLEYFIIGPLSWMGIVDLGMDEKRGEPNVFKISNWASSLLAKRPVVYETLETSEFIVQTNGEILVPNQTQREIRYQIARFCVWVNKLQKFYRYKICANAFKRADAQNLTPAQIKTLVEKYGKKPIPSNIITAIVRWKKQQAQIKVKDQTLIHTASAEILDAIQNSPADKYVIERLNETAAIISSKNLHRLEKALIHLGYFSDIYQDV
jgi:hypothetical protein